jgi:hypothetical protein
MNILNAVKQTPTWITVLSSTIAGLGVIGGGAWATYSHFQTDTEANTSHKEIRAEAEAGILNLSNALAQAEQRTYDAFKQDRIDRLERERERVMYQLLSPSLTAQEREFLNNRLDEIKAKVKCIREDKC